MEKLILLKERLKAEGASLAVAESLTCGNLQALVGRVSGASDFFKGGITAYNLGQKVKHLAVEEIHAAKENCVSAQVAKEMAKGVSCMFRSSLSIATTGFAELSDSTPYAYYAIYDRATDSFLEVKKVEKAGLDRVSMQQFVAKTALDALYRNLAL